jgi:hypothetical protein
MPDSVGVAFRLALLTDEKMDGCCHKHYTGIRLEPFDEAHHLMPATWDPAQTLPHLRKQLQPVPGLAAEDKEKAIRWIKNLDHRRFPLREEASRELFTHVGQQLFVHDAAHRAPPIETTLPPSTSAKQSPNRPA